MPKAVYHRHATAAAVAAILLASGAHAEEASSAVPAAGAGAAARAAVLEPDCFAGQCKYRLSASQLLALAEKLVRDKKFDEARPLVSALKAAPGMELPYNFLDGMIAIETGDAKTAAERFRAILKDHPGQTRVRLELARALMMQGKLAGADYHLRLAQNDEDLPEDIARMIGNARSIIRSNRKFRFGFDFGFAPDSNINSATAAETVDVNFGPMRVPLALDKDSRAQSGLGITASVYAGVRVPAADGIAIVADLDADSVTYEEEDYNDYSVQLAAGPEIRLSRTTQVRVQAVGLYRWYGGEVAARQYGSKLTVQHNLDETKRIAVQLDGRRSESELNPGYTGWQLGANATYEQVVGKSAILSGSILARRDFMDFDAYSSKTIGLNAGIGGELPLGINAGLSGGAIYMKYDEPQYFFSFDKREDWRYQARAYAGLRQFRLAGFSPSLEYQFLKVDSNYDLYKSERHRFQFKLARYF